MENSRASTDRRVREELAVPSTAFLCSAVYDRALFLQNCKLDISPATPLFR